MGQICQHLRGSVIPALGHLALQELTTQYLDEYCAACLKEKPGRQSDSRRRPHRRKVKEGETPSQRRRGETLSPTTVHHSLITLKMALSRAVQLGLLVRNPAYFTKPPRPNRPEMQMLCEEDVKRLLEALEKTPRGLTGILALMTGARLGEILGLRWRDIDLDAQMMYVRQTLRERRAAPGKTWYWVNGKGRPVDLDAGTAARLKAHRKAQNKQRLALGLAWPNHDLVITNSLGEPVRPSTVSAQFRKVPNLSASCGYASMMRGTHTPRSY